MSIHEADRGELIDFMDLDEFDDMWDVNIISVLPTLDPKLPNGYYERVSVVDGDPDYPPAFVILIPGDTDEEDTAIAFLRQVELIRRELRDGRRGLPKADRNPRLIGQVELSFAAARFYSLHKEIVDQVIYESIGPDLASDDDEEDDDLDEPFQEEGN